MYLAKLQGMTRYSIKDLERLSGVKAHTIRIWEKRYNIITPQRTSTNIRFYTDKDLKKLLNVSLLNQYGHKISAIAEMSNLEINQRITEITEITNDSNAIAEQLIVAMIEFDRLMFDKLVSDSIVRNGFEETMKSIIFPFLEKVGVLWQTGNVYPSQEHFVTNIIRMKLFCAIEGQRSRVKENMPTFLLFLPNNEYHELFLLFSYYLLSRNGFEVVYLGQSVPFDDLLIVNRYIRIDYFLTSFTTSITRKRYTDFIDSISTKFPDRQIFIAGSQPQQHKVEYPSNITVVGAFKNFTEIIARLLADFTKTGQN